MPALRNLVSTVAAACTTKPRSKSDPSDHPLARTLGSPSSSSRINVSLTRAFKTRSRTISSSSDFGCTGAMEWDRYYNSPDGPGSAFPSPLLSECTSPCSPLSMPTTPSAYSPYSSTSSPKSTYSPITPVQEDPFKDPAGSAFPFPTFKTPLQIATLDQYTFPVTPINASKAFKRTSPPSPSPAPAPRKREPLVRGVPLTRLSVHNGQQPASLFEDQTIATFCSPPSRTPSVASVKLQSLQEEEEQDEEIDDEWSPKLGTYPDAEHEDDESDKLSLMVAAATSPRVEEVISFGNEAHTRQESWMEAFKSLEQESSIPSETKSVDKALLPSAVIMEKAYPAPMVRASSQALVSERITKSDKAAQAAFSALFSQHSSPKASSDPSPKLSAEEQWLENASLQIYDGTIDFEERPVLSTSLLLAPLALKRRIAARAQKELERLEFANKALPPLPSTLPTSLPDGMVRPRSSSLPNILTPSSRAADWPSPKSAEEPIVSYCESKLRSEMDPFDLDDIDSLISANNWTTIIPQPASAPISLKEAQAAVSTSSNAVHFDASINGEDPFVDILPLSVRKETSSPKVKSSKKPKSKSASPSSSPVLSSRKKAIATEFVIRSMEVRAEKYWVPPTGGRKVRKYSKSLPASTVHIEARVRNAVYAGGLPC